MHKFVNLIIYILTKNFTKYFNTILILAAAGTANNNPAIPNSSPPIRREIITNTGWRPTLSPTILGCRTAL